MCSWPRCSRSGRRDCSRRAPDGGASVGRRRSGEPAERARRHRCRGRRFVRPTTRLDRSLAIGFALVALALPFILEALGAGYYLSLASRIVIYAIAATSLNLVLGYAGLVSFGHAAFVGLGAYATGILVSEGVVGSGWHLLATLAVTGLAALAIGAISLRTRGVYFIMITLAFAQMLFYLANSVKGYGGDEGLNIRARSMLGFGAFAVDLRIRSPSGTWPSACSARRCSRSRGSARRASAAPCWRCATTTCAPKRSAFRPIG